MSPEIEDRRKRLLYRASYRGFKEADLLIGAFARENIPEMTSAELDEFDALLTCNDHDLYAWATGNADPPPEFSGAIMEKLQKFKLFSSS